MEKRRFELDDGPDEKRFRSEEGFDEHSADEAAFYMEQRLVGWVIGRGGATLKDIEQAYFVRVVVDQGTKDFGYSKVKITGSRENWQAAAEHINQSLARAATNPDGTSSVGPFLLESPPEAAPAYSINEEMRIEQRYVGWLLGKSGGVVREIEQNSGCKISINQDSRPMGYSRAVFHGSFSERQAAKQLIEDSITRAKANGVHQHGPKPLDDEPRIEQVQVEQQWVGWLLGKGGQVMKEMEQQSGARITIDQSTKDLGFSTVCVSGSRGCIATARQLVLEKVAQVNPSGTAQPSFGSAHLATPVREQFQAPPGPAALSDEAQAACAALLKQLGHGSRSEDPIAKVRRIAKTLLAATEPRLDPGGGFASPALTSRGRPPLVAPKLAAAAAAAPLTAPSPTAPREETIELHVDQKCVGWILGRSGATMREIESESGAKVSIDQSTKDLGFSVVKMAGNALAVQHAQQRIQASLAIIAPNGEKLSLGSGATSAGGAEGSPSATVGNRDSEEIQVEQRRVGWLLGCRGVVLKEIEQQSGARISIDQSTKDLGFSTVQLTGSLDCVAMARHLVTEKISQAR